MRELNETMLEEENLSKLDQVLDVVSHDYADMRSCRVWPTNLDGTDYDLLELEKAWNILIHACTDDGAYEELHDVVMDFDEESLQNLYTAAERQERTENREPRTMTACAQAFLLGWHARSLVEGTGE